MTNRFVTDIHERILKRRAALDGWLSSGADEASAPETPFLDRLERLCKKAGRSRPAVLKWIGEYSARNELCHKTPPKFEHHQKTIEKDGKVVMVNLDKENPEDCIDWVSMKAAIDERKANVEKEHEYSRCNKERRDFLIELIDAYWGAVSNESDEASNPILSAYAKNQVKAMEEPAKDPPKE